MCYLQMSFIRTVRLYLIQCFLLQSCSMFVTSYSSIRTLPASQAFRVNHSDSTVDGISLVPAGWIVEPRGLFN